MQKISLIQILVMPVYFERRKTKDSSHLIYCFMPLDSHFRIYEKPPRLEDSENLEDSLLLISSCKKVYQAALHNHAIESPICYESNVMSIAFHKLYVIKLAFPFCPCNHGR